MKKTTQSEGKIEVLRGREAEVLNEQFAKTGKYAVSDFSDDERNELDQALNEVRAEENTPEVERAEDQTDSEEGGDK
jgi:hypothetical protein